MLARGGATRNPGFGEFFSPKALKGRPRACVKSFTRYPVKKYLYELSGGEMLVYATSNPAIEQFSALGNSGSPGMHTW